MLGAVKITSLGYRTDVALRILEGADVVEHKGYLVIRSPADPLFRWGNFLLIPPPAAGEAGRWCERFQEAFPDACHIALGVNVADAAAVDAAEFAAWGFGVECHAVLTAAAVRPPLKADLEADVRPLSGDEDWRQSAELRIAGMELAGGREAGHVEFLRTRAVRARTVTEAGHGTWFGAFDDGHLVAQLGVMRAGPGTVRYQDVETHPQWRRRGLAGALVYLAGVHALAWSGVRTLVIVAEPEGDAIRLYRSAGFADAEAQLALARAPVAAA